MRALLPCALTLVACAGHAPPTATAVTAPAPLVVATPTPSQAAARVAPPARPVDRAVRVDGLARFDRVALVEGGVVCGTRAGQRPVCAPSVVLGGDLAVAARYEQLADVVALVALGTTRCALFGDGRLACASTSVDPPATWPVRAHQVADVVISSAPAGDTVFTLGRDGAVRRVDAPGSRAAPALATDVTSVASLGTSGVCAVTRGGLVSCSDPRSSALPLVPTAVTDGRAVFYGGAVVRAAGGGAFARGASPAYDPLPAGMLDYAHQGLCALVAGGAIRCAGLAAGWLDIELPAPADRIGPRGDALCAVLVDGTTACWGPFLADLQRLGARSSTALAR